MDQRDFKGVWFPKEVWLDSRLNALEKIILLEIDSLDTPEEGCFASNDYLASFCQCSERKVTDAISKLIELNYIYVESFDGRKRFLRSRLTNNAMESSKNCEAEQQNLRERKIKENTILEVVNYNSKETHKENDLQISCESDADDSNKVLNEIETAFDAFWKAYPKKVNKQGAYRTFKNIKNIKNIYKDIISSVEYFKTTKDWQKENGQYIPYPQTFLNQRRWEDEKEKSRKDMLNDLGFDGLIES